tara:strand:- start:1614 stop:2108 length:495 start_codon:yes stop_codon:yes gene_type:complete
MAQTRTGLNNWLGEMGTNYAHELTRQAARIASELGEEATSGIPKVVSVLRRQEVTPANTALGIVGQYNAVAGLENIPATVFHPNKWNEEGTPADVNIREAKRSILLADVPAGGGVGADRVVPTDVIEYDDPLYGLAQFEVKSATTVPGPGLVRVEVEYCRESVA